jgi:hypothetical protein
MDKLEAVDIFKNSKYSDIGFDRIEETKNYFIFSLDPEETISDPIAIDKRSGRCFGYNPVKDGE